MSTAPVFVALTKNNILLLKRALHARFPELKSTHVTEALAAALGSRTHAALLSRISSASRDSISQPVDQTAFEARLTELAGDFGPVETTAGGLFHGLQYLPGTLVTRTWSPGFSRVKYETTRLRAWRNMMVAVINAGLDQKLFGLRPGENYWPGANDTPEPIHVFEFEIEGIPALGAVSDGGFDEIRIKTTFWPLAEGKRWVRATNSRFLSGDAHATGWIERRQGAYLQASAGYALSCRKVRQAAVASLDVRPNGYADRGTFHL